MKKIMIGEENKVTGKILIASAKEYIEDKIYGYLLTNEEAEETCHFGSGEFICTTCNYMNCQWYEERLEGYKLEPDEGIMDFA